MTRALRRPVIRFAAPLLLALVALLAPAAARAQADDGQVLADYRLSEPVLAKFVAATRGITAAAAADPQLASRLEAESSDGSTAPTIAGIAAVYDRHAPIRGALEGAGITSREYVTFMLSMMQAGLRAVMVKQDAALLERLPAGAARENVRFYQRHEADLTRLGEEIARSRNGGA